MIASFIADVFGDVLFDILFGWALPSRAHKPPPEGNWNASLGALSAFFALDSVLAVVIAVMALRDAQASVVLPVGASSCALVLAFIAFRCPDPTPKVTSRRLGLAAAGMVLSIAAG